MDFEQELSRMASVYANQGYEVITRPETEALPLFAKDFRIEILGRRGDEGVMVAVKKDRDQVASDLNLTRYAKVTNSQKGWRFDLAVLEAERSGDREIQGAIDFTKEDIEKSFDESLELSMRGYDRPAMMTAWAGFEAAMRQRLRAEGGQAGWGLSPTSMLNELYSAGSIDSVEFARLQMLSRARNQMIHGFTSSEALDPGSVEFLGQVGKRLVMESEKQVIRNSS